jgi:quercetin dioxygenase-like cupin family protein
MNFVVNHGDGEPLPGAAEIVIKVRSEDTGGVMAVIEQTVLPHTLIPPHIHSNDVWVYVLSGEVGVLVGEKMDTASAGGWALKPRSVMHAMWNAGSEPARIIEVLTPAGSERWFEEVTHLAEGDSEGFSDACERHGIQFLIDSPWTGRLRNLFELT